MTGFEGRMLNIHPSPRLKDAPQPTLYKARYPLQMDIVRVFNYNNSDYTINLTHRAVGDEILFDASSVERVLDIKNIRQTIRDFDDDKRVTLAVDTAGGSQMKTYLTQKGLFNVIFASRKPVAKQFQDWVFDVIRTVATEGRYELETRLVDMEARLLESETQSVENAALARHNSILEAYDMQHIVYIAYMETLSDSKYVIKIGWSNNAKRRTSSLQTDFGPHRFVYAIRVRRNKDFESFLHAHAIIAPHKYEEPINGMKRSSETFEVDDTLFKRIKALMKREVHRFNTTTVKEELQMRKTVVAEQRVQIDRLRVEMEVTARAEANEAIREFASHLTTLKDQLGHFYAELLDKPNDRDVQARYDMAAANYNAATLRKEYLQASAIPTTSAPETTVKDGVPLDFTTQQKSAEALRVAHMKPTTVSRGRFVQQYDPMTLKLIANFAGPTEAIRALGGGCPQRLVKAAEDKTVFKKFRWHQVDRDSDPTTDHDIGDTVEIRQANTGLVAVYSRDGKSIDNVFPDQKSVRDYLQIKSAASVSNAVSSGLTRKCQGVLVGMWDDVAEELKEAYLKTKTLPAPAAQKGRTVLQIDSGTGQTIARHPNVASVALQFRMSHMTVVKACDSREFHAGFTWAWEETS